VAQLILRWAIAVTRRQASGKSVDRGALFHHLVPTPNRVWKIPYSSDTNEFKIELPALK
jgi:hypothetical protein